jgi:plasmid replication initiation protein
MPTLTSILLKELLKLLTSFEGRTVEGEEITRVRTMLNLVAMRYSKLYELNVNFLREVSNENCNFDSVCHGWG